MNVPPRFLAWLAVLCLMPADGFACSVPVFRYALEHWQPDPYRITIYHDQDLGEADQELLSWLRSRESAGANIEVRTIDVREPLDPQDQARWESVPDRTTPHLTVHLPVRSTIRIGRDVPVGTATWNESEVRNLIASPARTEIGRRLVAGEVVWVFLDSGNPEIDDPLFETLNEQLGINQRTLKLPSIEEEDLDELSTDPTELKIRFSSLRIARDDPAEKWLVDILLSVESDLRDEGIVNQPMVFPVFGRGRALYALVGKGIAADTIRRAASFLTGACQCTVKAQNPGVDLLMPVRWDEFIQKTEPEEVELALVGLGGDLPLSSAADSGEATEPAESSTAAPVPPPTDASDESRAKQLAELPASDATGGETASVLWLPVTVLLVIGAVVGFWGTSILRRQ